MNKLLKYLAVRDVRSQSEAFMSFWESLNNELEKLGYKEATYGDAKDEFSYNLTATEAVDHLLMIRGER
jgi:hypothetical protein